MKGEKCHRERKTTNSGTSIKTRRNKLSPSYSVCIQGVNAPVKVWETVVVKRAVSIYPQPQLIERIEAAGRSVSNYVERVLDAVTPRVLGEQVLVASNIPDERPLEAPGKFRGRIRNR
jgi:hypothetical protein